MQGNYENFTPNALQKELVTRFGYSKLPDKDSKEVRELFKSSVPKWMRIDGNPFMDLYSLSGTHIATGYERVVVGDYGAFVEVGLGKILSSNLVVKKGQEYRKDDPKFRMVKYLWLTADDDSGVKVYLQKRTVDYADYKIGMYYVSPFEVTSNHL